MFNYTLKPVLLKSKKNPSGIYPLKIRITVKRKHTYLRTNYSFHESQFVDGQVMNYPNSALINSAIRKQITDIEKAITEKNINGKKIDIKHILKEDDTLFRSFAEKLLNKEPSTNKARKMQIEKVITFAGEDLKLSDINIDWLHRFEDHERGRGMAQNTLNTAFKFLSVVLTRAQREGVITTNPIRQYRIPKYEQTERIFLTEAERKKMIHAWESRKFSGPHHTTLTWFIFGMLTGLRYSDWQTFDASKRVEGDRLKLRAQKNKKWVTLPIGKTLSQIIPLLKKYPVYSNQKSSDHLKYIAGKLRIGKNLSCHVSRHTFCVMCIELKIPRAVICELMGISDRVISVYYHMEGSTIIEQAAALMEV